MHRADVKKQKSGKSFIVLSITIGIALLLGGVLAFTHYGRELELFENSKADTNAFFANRISDPFVNSAADDSPYIPAYGRDDALYYFEAPEGFSIISHSREWNEDMLSLLYDELKQNAHGEEIEKLSEIVVYGHDNNEMNALATYSPGITSASFFINFPAFPSDFSIDFPKFAGIINIYGGDTKTTIESIASSLSHEYGHHFTFYYMFDYEMREQNRLTESTYAELRETRRFNLIGRVEEDADYFMNRFRYLIEIAAEDYVQLMGSPATRNVVDFIDVKQIAEGAQQARDGSGARNAFPQENMMIPLAAEVSGLAEYFYGYIGEQPRVPVEERQDITLDINRHSVQHNLADGPKTFVYYTLTWNTPYQNAIYTISCYDPYDYTGWGLPIKTVRPGGAASAVIGEYAVARGGRVYFANDNVAQGFKAFYVVAQLPDGTYYVSDKLEYNFR
ncbi:MAG: hypothetical protein FWD44_04770 [Oscillospiraceae bacterium]|nr:hypothetical protein [Oscillospiraceae bacterium]